jgi:uncharacterized protein (DUF924 family)
VTIADGILDFWFGPRGAVDRFEPRECWFEKDDAFDRTIRERFAAALEAAAMGALDRWLGEPESSLALVVLLDQFPRNMYRNTPRMYAYDPKARAVARAILERGYDGALHPVARWFVYLPFVHSEILADQEQGLALAQAMPSDGFHGKARESAARHHEIVAKFGRFPHRNAVLGRATTDDEARFLDGPNSSF